MFTFNWLKKFGLLATVWLFLTPFAMAANIANSPSSAFQDENYFATDVILKIENKTGNEIYMADADFPVVIKKTDANEVSPELFKQLIVPPQGFNYNDFNFKVYVLPPQKTITVELTQMPAYTVRAPSGYFSGGGHRNITLFTNYNARYFVSASQALKINDELTPVALSQSQRIVKVGTLFNFKVNFLDVTTSNEDLTQPVVRTMTLTNLNQN